MATKKAAKKALAKAGAKFQLEKERDPIDWLPVIYDEITKGNRRDAAYTALKLAEDHPDNALFLAGLVVVLAEKVCDMGDAHKKRGNPGYAPPVNSVLPYTHPENRIRQLRKHMRAWAVDIHKYLIEARDIIDERQRDPGVLAEFIFRNMGKIEGSKGDVSTIKRQMTEMIEGDIDDGIRLAKEGAMDLLVEYKLQNARRQGFPSRSRTAVAERWGFTVDQLKTEE